MKWKRTNCKEYVGKKEPDSILCNYWEVAGEPLIVQKKYCNKKCPRYTKKER